MTRFYRFLITLFASLLILSMVYALVMSFVLFEFMRMMLPSQMILFRMDLIDYISASIVPTFFLAFAQIIIITMLLKRAVERGLKISIRNIFQTIGIFFLLTTTLVVVHVGIFLLINSKDMFGIFNAFDSVTRIGWLSFPVCWLLLYFYLVKKFKLTGPLVEETTFDFEQENVEH